LNRQRYPFFSAKSDELWGGSKALKKRKKREENMLNSRESGKLALDLFASSSYQKRPEPTVFPSEMFGQELRYSRLYLVMKRALDICGALVGLLILLVFLPLIALLIWCEDAGPIFYKQTRVGQHGRAFSLYKLRTMVVDADAYLKQHPDLLAAWQKNGKLHDDPRITRVGRFLRQTSIDELPQLWNVLRGEMSLVGPRAIQFSEVGAFRDLIEMRQQAKPGLTGLWQVSGRSATSYEQRSVLDCTYVMECSIWMDIAILCKTLPTVSHRVGAY
jgi:undecaprenyl-phosphate galactose phosphotransferase